MLPTPKLRSLLVCTIALLATATAAAQNTIHVPADQPTIQAGINAANTGDTVLVAPGTYYENIDFKGKAITVTSTSGSGGGAANTIIDGGQNGPAVTFKTSETRAAIVSGLTITHGGTNYMNYANSGPGVSITNSQPTVLNNIITQNYCLGIYTSNAAPLIQGNVVSASLTPSKCSVSNGGGIFIASDLVTGDPGDFTIVRAQIIGNTIENNSTGEEGDGGGDGGAGIYVQGGSPLIQNNIIRNNEAQSGVGGGIYVDYTTGLAIVQNQIYDNDAGCGGGGIAFEGGIVGPPFFVLIANNTIVDNTSNFGGGYSNCQQIAQIFAFPGRYGESGPNAVFVNNIISGSTTYPAINCDNITGNRSEAAQPIFDHNLLYNADGAFFGSYCVDTSAKYGNTVAPPTFMNAANHEYQLLSTSHGIDVGNTSVLQSIAQLSGARITQDFAGNSRLEDATGIGYPVIDMGAYEYAGVVDAQPTTIVLSSSAYTGDAGSNYVLIATLASNAGVPSGAVTFFVDAKQIGVSSIEANGVATLNNVLLTPGVHVLYATYPGQGSFTPATSVIIIVDISLYSPSLTLTSTPNPSNLGQSVQFNVNISSADTNKLGPIVVTNTITNATLATLTPDASGNASFTTSSLPLGDNYLQATYAGDASHNSASNFPPLDQQVVDGYPTTPSLTCTPSTINIGATSLLSAMVTSTSGSPTGSITFTDGTTTLITAPLTNGVASDTYTGTSTGTHTLTATYVPTGSFAASSATCSVTVIGLPTTDTLTVTPTSATTSTTFAAMATIQPVSPGPSPTGIVTFSVTIPPSTVPQNQQPVALTPNGASFILENISSSFIVGCTYSGDAVYAPGTCSSVNVPVAASPTTTTTLAITAGGSLVSTVPAGTVVTLTATTLAGTSPISPGQVNFCDATAPNCLGLNLIGTAQLTPAGAAALKFVARAGTHSYNAVFLGTSTNTTSSSAAQPLTVTVTSSPGTITLADTGVPGKYTLTATVTGSAATTPTGTVSFLDTTNANYLLGSANLSTGTSGLIWTASTIPTNVSPGSLVAADFNNDGYADLALTTRDSVSILNGNGNGEFPRTTTVAVGHAPGYLAVADFNGDGTPDLAISNQSDGSVTILTSSGNGFDVFAPIPVGLNVEAITTGDFNHDGNADFAVIYNENSIAVFLGKGDGTFTPVAAHPTTDVEPTSIVTGDFNGDGNLDLILSNAIGSGPTVNGNLTVLLGNGDGTFTPAASPSTGVNPESIAVGDFNNDGKLDLAVANYTSNTVTILLGNGDGTFSSSSVAAGAAPWSVSVADFNGDGIPDLLVVPAVGATAATTILIGKGDGTFSAITGPSTGNAPLYGVIADFNSDGVPDFAISNAADSTLGLFLTQTASTSTAVVNNISPVGTGPHLVDATYGGSTSNTVSLTAQRVPTTLALTATAAPSGGPIALAAAISPNTAQNHSAGGSVTFFDNGNTLGTGTVSSGVATLAVASFPAGLNNLSAQYSGDTNFAPSSGTGSITIAPAPPADFTFIGPPTVTFRTESTGVATLSLASLNGFAAPIAVTCNSPLPPNYLCTLSNSTVSLAANNTASLTLTLHPNLNASLTFPPRPFPSKTAVALASLLPLTLLSLFRRRRRDPLHRLLLLVCLAAAATALTACGSDIDYPATPPGLYPITITATGTSQGASASTTHALLLNANITP